jgi:hypothetical protein
MKKEGLFIEILFEGLFVCGGPFLIIFEMKYFRRISKEIIEMSILNRHPT